MLPPLRFFFKNRFESLDFALQRLDFVPQEIGMNSGGQPQQEVDSEVSWNFYDCILKGWLAQNVPIFVRRHEPTRPFTCVILSGICL